MRILEEALIEYVERYGVTEKARLAFAVWDSGIPKPSLSQLRTIPGGAKADDDLDRD